MTRCAVQAALMLVLLSIPAHATGQRYEGEFQGGRTSGDVTIEKIDGRWFVRLGNNFRHDGAPDPWVALGKDGFRRDALLGRLQSDQGTQLYPIPDRFDPAEFNQVYIWCQEFSTSLGRAWLQPVP